MRDRLVHGGPHLGRRARLEPALERLQLQPQRHGAAWAADMARVSCSRRAIRARCRRDFTDETGSVKISALPSFESSPTSPRATTPPYSGASRAPARPPTARALPRRSPPPPPPP